MTNISSLEINSKAFPLLLEKVIELPPNQFAFKLGNYIFVSRYTEVETNKNENSFIASFPVLETDINRSDVRAIVFDVIGIRRQYITEVEVRKVNNGAVMIFISPSCSIKTLKEFANAIYREME